MPATIICIIIFQFNSAGQVSKINMVCNKPLQPLICEGVSVQLILVHWSKGFWNSWSTNCNYWCLFPIHLWFWHLVKKCNYCLISEHFPLKKKKKTTLWELHRAEHPQQDQGRFLFGIDHMKLIQQSLLPGYFWMLFRNRHLFLMYLQCKIRTF